MWQPDPRISVVIPVFNEEESLPTLHQKLSEALLRLDVPYEVVYVDDGSRDRSFEVLKSIAEYDANIKIVRLRRNFGQTPALVAGFDQARGEIIVTMDADIQNDPADIPRLLAKIDEGYDIVSGWRKNRKDPALGKALPSKISNKLASKLTGVHLHDFGCTLKAYRREVLQGIHLYGELHRYIPAVASSFGVRVAEIEVQHHPRAFGKSKYGITRLARGLMDLVTLKLLLTYMNRPMQMFGGLGILSFLAAMLSGAATVAMWLFLKVDITGNPLLYLTILLVLACIQFISLGFLGEITSRTYHETQRKPIYVVREIVTGRPLEPVR
ncbi:MAG: glycosyltransferase family 2 protein [Chloroflexi bacterium]|nr:glycosyltransferase family 2 protein [Chloroflexota bacterium]